MKQHSTKRTPVAGRVRLALLMLVTIFSHFGLSHLFKNTLKSNLLEKYQKALNIRWNSHILTASHSAYEHRSPRR